MVAARMDNVSGDALAPLPSAPLWSLDATAIAALVNARTVRAIDVIEAAIARIEQTKAVNAVILPCFDDARQRARELDKRLDAGTRLPLAGVPVTIKDQMRVAGLPTTLGLPSRRELIDRDEGPLVTRLRAAGAIVVGKTNTPQLLFGFETDNKLWGRTVNPWDARRAPAGSSGGEAANLAAGGAAIGLGGDLGGSIRAPAAVTGLFGLRPTGGRLSGLDFPGDIGFAPLHGMTPQHGPLARSARDIGLMMSILHDADAGDLTTQPVPLRDWSQVRVDKLRIGYFDDDKLVRPSPAVRRAVKEAADALAAAGAHVEVIEAPPSERALQIAMSLLSSDGGANIKHALGANKPDPDLGSTLRGMGAPKLMLRLITRLLRWKGEKRLSRLLAGAGKKTARELALLLAERDQMRAQLLAQLDARKLDAIICPPCAVVAAKHGFPEQGMLACGYTFLFSLLDLPAGVAPITRVREGEETDREVVEPTDKEIVKHEAGTVGLPVGVQIAARPWREDVVIAVMAELDRRVRTHPDFPVTPIDPR